MSAFAARMQLPAHAQAAGNTIEVASTAQRASARARTAFAHVRGQGSAAAAPSAGGGSAAGTPKGAGEEEPGWFERRRRECYDGPMWLPPEKPRNWFIYVAAYIVRPAMKLAFRYEVEGEENIPLQGVEPVVFACNHVSFADPVITWCSLYGRAGGTRILARSSLFKPVLGGLIARAGGIPIDPDSADKTAIKRAAAALKRGEHLFIFPEGTRMNKPDKVYKPHGGVVLIARMGKAKIVPVGISGTDKIMPYGKAKFIRFPKVHVRYGEAIDVNDERFADVPKKERSTAIAAYVMQRCFELRDGKL